ECPRTTCCRPGASHIQIFGRLLVFFFCFFGALLDRRWYLFERTASLRDGSLYAGAGTLYAKRYLLVQLAAGNDLYRVERRCDQAGFKRREVSSRPAAEGVGVV